MVIGNGITFIMGNKLSIIKNAIFFVVITLFTTQIVAQQNFGFLKPDKILKT
jgi:hypothetical protein